MFTNLFIFRSRFSQDGFTLIELVSVIIIIGVIAVSIAPRFTGTQFAQINIKNAAQLVKSDLMYTQRKAMGEGTSYSVVFTSGSGTYTRAGDTRKLTDLNPNLTVSTTTTITFNSFGEPDGKTGVTTITLSQSGSTQNVTVEPYTGYVNIP